MAAAAAPDVSMEEDEEEVDNEVINPITEVIDISDSDVTDSDDEDWVEDGGDDAGDSEQDQSDLIKDLKKRLRVAIQKAERRKKSIKKIRNGKATKTQVRKYLRGSYSHAYTNWILRKDLRKKKARVGHWTHTGKGNIPRSGLH